MDEDHVDLSDLDGLEAAEPPTDGSSEVPEDEPEASDPASPLPVDQRALNIIGLAQAREQLRAARRRREQGADPPATDVEDELQASVDRHPAGWARSRTQRPLRDQTPGADGGPKESGDEG